MKWAENDVYFLMSTK